MKYRDLTLLAIDEMFPIGLTKQRTEEDYLVFACDSSASIGEKANDQLASPNPLTAQTALRVPLIELRAVNAEPVLAFYLVNNEMNPTGLAYQEGFQAELDRAGFPHIQVNGSTEENMLTTMSALGIVLMGKAQNAKGLWIRRVVSGDRVFQLKRPRCGQAVLDEMDKLVSYQDIDRLLSRPDLVHEICPIGSKGALNEAGQVADCNQLSFKANPQVEGLSIHQDSAGPATALVVVGTDQLGSFLKEHFDEVYDLGVMV
ncbi:hypothetical protein [Aerococcus sp. Group 2]|uniref:hypothetical protein n=1 Tax=Aerococcus sp. Group 2 TaxID=2976811 RepID=UPI00227BDC38|nr:hypothetical protein [Aerococcus sp. Group 2]MCY3035446.1 hypothetical protein [Aerococcus sp. Group 2]